MNDDDIQNAEQNALPETAAQKWFKQLTKVIIYIGLSGLLLFIIGIALSGITAMTPLYTPNYELKILRETNPISYKCDSFSIKGNEYHLFDTNKVETNVIIIPNNLIIDIKTLNK